MKKNMNYKINKFYYQLQIKIVGKKIISLHV